MGDLVIAVSILSILFVLWTWLLGTLIGLAKDAFYHNEYGVGASYIGIVISTFFIGVGAFMKLLGL